MSTVVVDEDQWMKMIDQRTGYSTVDEDLCKTFEAVIIALRICSTMTSVATLFCIL